MTTPTPYQTRPTNTVFLAKTFYVWVAPAGTSAPADLTGTAATDSLTAVTGWKGLGYMTDDGLVFARSFNGGTAIKSYEGLTLISTTGSETETAKFTPQGALDRTVMDLWTGNGLGNTTKTSTGLVKATTGAGSFAPVSLVFDGFQDSRIYRAYMPSASVTDVDGETWKADSEIDRGMTFTANVGNSGFAVLRSWIEPSS